MSVRTGSLAATLVFGVLAAAAPAGNLMDNLFAKMEASTASFMADMEASAVNIFPAPQDEVLGRIRYAPDRIIWLFRESKAAEQRALGGSHRDQMLAEALTTKQNDLAWAFTRRLLEEHGAGKSKALKRLRDRLEDLPLAGDVGAFLPVFDRLPVDLQEEFSSAEATARGTDLSDPSTLTAYVAACAESSDFFKRRGKLRQLGGKVRKGVDGLLDRLEVRFSKENLARFFARLSASKLPNGVRLRAGDATEKLLGGLSEAIYRGLDDQLAGGMTGRVQMILESPQGILQKSSLTRGRLRVLMKLMKGLKDHPQDLKLFLPVHRDVKRWVTQRAGSRDVSTEGRAYLEELRSMLELTGMVYGKAARQPPSNEAPAKIWRSIWEAMKAEDFDGVFAEVAADPEIF